MELVDSRRLTGPNLLSDRRGAVIDVRCPDQPPGRVVDVWQQQVRRMLQAVGWSQETTCVRRFSNGLSLAISAPNDALFAATDINDWAWEATCRVLAGKGEPDLEAADALRAQIAAESDSRLGDLDRAARQRSLPLLSDTDNLSVGFGRGSLTWPLNAPPTPSEVPWSKLHGIPVGLITGTNGKTTCVRTAASLVRAAGLTAGLSSTDWIGIDDEILDYGDYSGPQGARTVLRDPRVDIAILETARGGLLRRGLAVERANAALITNVAADHLGEFGVENVDELADVKWVVTKALREGGRLILNADDERLVKRGRRCDLPITWFSPDPRCEQLRVAAARGSAACTVRDGTIAYLQNSQWRPVVDVADVPITLGGAAVHNVSNVLGVVGLAVALGLSFEAIRRGLRNMRPEDNPGRGNLFQVDGVTVVVDFAHNPHGMQAFLALGRNLPVKRRALLIGQAGDRSDEDIRGLVQAACTMPLDRVLVKNMEKYSRGRPDGEVAAIIREEFLGLGLPAQNLVLFDNEMDAVRDALAWAAPGDLVILLIHEDRDSVLDYLRARAETNPMQRGDSR
jgi:UDP-N-acetylmuramyl tripeptide synthase